ncbi:MAG TPA: HNH endonuclease family protein [Thermoleophilia bacterium]|nr:HNH endonuclease family protein [Thermoleophilia bacterium]
MNVPLERAAAWGHGFVTGLLVGILVAGLVCANASSAEACDRHEFTDRAGRCVMKHDAPRPSWGDPDRNCRSTRNDILVREALPYSLRMSEDGCKVLSGLWVDPYSGAFIEGTPSGTIEIDHLLPQSAARSMRRWDRETFEQFYRDPLNLTVSSRAANQAKSNRFPLSDWLPENEKATCWVTRRLDAVRRKYELRFKPLDMLHLSEWLERCRP